jgi:hypothetical protein
LVAAIELTSTRCVLVLQSHSNSRPVAPAQQLRVHFRRDVADFVEEQRAAIGQAPGAAILAVCLRECSHLEGAR